MRWWNSLSINEQNALIKKHFPPNFPEVSIHGNVNNIVEIWEKEHEDI